MKTKYLLATAALAGLFTACSQEEIFDATASKVDPLAGRPIVGNVEFVSNEPTTRYNSETGTAEQGDAIGLYLMDEFSGANFGNIDGELDNANETLFKYQSNWWTMYRMVDFISTNYGYELEGSAWVNRASQLVEGNYMVMMPKNDVATNRRDLWKEIKPVVDLKAHSEKYHYYVNRENQFMLDYKQIHRDQKKNDEGKLTINVKFRYILTYLKLAIENNAANRFIAEKIVFKAPDGKPLPTVAYVKPAGITPNWIDAKLEEQGEEIAQALDECGNVLGEGLYDETWFTQKVARSMVQYSTTADKVPYGMDNDKVAYEYVFNLPDEEDGGVKLLGNSDNGDPDGADRVLTASIALPAFNFEKYEYDWTDMEVVVYGKMWDPTQQAYRNGILRKRRGNDNADFNLNKLKLWESSMKEIPAVALKFDDNYFYQEEEIRVANTEDLLKLLEARLSAATTTTDINFEVYPYGNGLEITDAVVKLISDYEKDHATNVNITFKNRIADNTPIILMAADCINMFKYQGVNVIIGADQTVASPVSCIDQLVNKANLTINANLTAALIMNAEKAGVITVNEAKVEASIIKNMNEMTLNEGAIISGDVLTDVSLVAAGKAVINGNVTNDNDCVDCGKAPATLAIEAASSLTINGSLTNADIVENNGTLIVTKSVSNEKDATFTSNIATLTNFTNNGVANLSGATELLGTSSNAGTINIGAEGKVDVNVAKSVLENTGTINVEGDLMDNIENSGYIYVIKNGHVIVNGCIESAKGIKGIIDVTAANPGSSSNEARDQKSENYFRYDVAAETTASDLGTALYARISSANLTGYKQNPIIIRWVDGYTTATSFGGTPKYNIERVIIEKDLNFSATTIFNNLKNDCSAVGDDSSSEKAFFVKNGATVAVINNASLTLANGIFNPPTTNACIDGDFKVKNDGNVLGKVLVYGSGRLENATGKIFSWEKARSFTGTWWGE